MKERSISSFISDGLKWFDYFSVTFEFRVDKKSRYRSLKGGIFFILFLILSFWYIIQSFVDYIPSKKTEIRSYESFYGDGLNYKEYNFSYTIQITLNNDPNVTQINNTKFADLFKISHNYIIKNLTDNDKNNTESYPRSCNSGDFSEELLNYPIFNRRGGLSNFNCFDFKENFSLHGDYTNETLKYSEILISINDKYLNSSYQMTKHYKNLFKIFKENKFQVTLYYIDIFDDLSNNTNPITYKIDSLFDYLDLFSFKRINIFFQDYRFELDKNLFCKNPIIKPYMNFVKSEAHFNSMLNRNFSNISDLYLMKINLRSVNHQKIVKMSYTKIPDFLISSGTPIMNILFFLKIIFNYFNHFGAKQSILNKIMKYKDIIKSNNKKTLNYLYEKIVDDKIKYTTSLENINSSDESHRKLIYFSTKNSINKIDDDKDLNTLNKNLDLEKIIKENDCLGQKFLYIEKDKNLGKKSIEDFDSTMRNNKLYFENKEKNLTRINPEKILKKNGLRITNNQEFSINHISVATEYSSKENQKISISRNPYGLHSIDICRKFLCCCKSEKQKIFEIAEKKFNHNIDLVNYMKKIQELDILKYLILDENTLQLMNFISKPCVSMSNQLKDQEFKLFFDHFENDICLTYKNIDNVKKSYDHIVNKTSKSKIEERVLKLFEYQVKEIFE